MISMIIEIIDVFKMFRINEWRAYFGLYTYGILYFTKSLIEILLKMLYTFPLFFLYMASIYLANNISDIDGDKINPNKINKNILVKKHIDTRLLNLSLLILLFLAIIYSFILPPLGQEIYIISLLLGIFYSFKPLRFKEKPFLDLFSHSIFFGIGLILFTSQFNLNFKTTLIILIIAIYSIILELRNEIEDYEYDKNAGYTTTVVSIGSRNGMILIDLLLLIMLIGFTLLYTNILFKIISISLIFIPYLLRKDFHKMVRIFDIIFVFLLALTLIQDF